jgi:hypothetical protein
MIALLFPALVAWCALCWWVGTLVAKPAWPKAEPTRAPALQLSTEEWDAHDARIERIIGLQERDMAAQRDMMNDRRWSGLSDDISNHRAVPRGTEGGR